MIVTRDVKINADGTLHDSQAGDVLIIESVSAGTLDIQFLDAGGQARGIARGATAGRKYRPGFTFGGFILTGTAGAVVRLLIGDGDADSFLSTLTVTIANAQLSTVELLAAALAAVAPVAVDDTRDALLAADATRRVVYFYNAGGDTVYLGGAAVTAANAAIPLLPGQVWVEDRAPGAAWYGVCGAGLASTINVMTGV